MSEDFTYFRHLSASLIGNTLEADKDYLLQGRLSALALREKAESVMALLARLRSQPTGPLHWEAVEAMTTKETMFFRDQALFDMLESQVLHEVVAARRAYKTLRFWSAACASGQEPYSLAMLLWDGYPEVRDWDVRILASDVSAGALERARSGLYSDFEVERGLPVERLHRHFDKHPRGWCLRPGLRSMVSFQRINLAGPWPAMDTFDLVLLRNVLLYFDEPLKRSIIGQAHSTLSKSGYLFLGAAENLMEHPDLFTPFISGRTLGFRPVH